MVGKIRERGRFSAGSERMKALWMVRVVKAAVGEDVVGAGKGKSEMGLWYIWRNSEKTGVPSDVLRSSFCFPSVIMM